MKKPVAMVERIADGEAPMVSLFDRGSNVFLVEGARLRTPRRARLRRGSGPADEMKY